MSHRMRQQLAERSEHAESALAATREDQGKARELIQRQEQLTRSWEDVSTRLAGLAVADLQDRFESRP